jgi:Arc/MetJ-type ribon-helix-helix transcriptional regulator
MTLIYQAILVDVSASDWVKDALRSALERDPVDALNDAEILAKALRENLDDVQRRINAFMNKYMEQIDE